MDNMFTFSQNKDEQVLELILFTHLATIHCDSHLHEQERILTQRVIQELVSRGYEREILEKKIEKIEHYILSVMRDKTKDFFQIFETLLKQAIPPADISLYNSLAHLIIKSAYSDNDYKEQERRLFERFREIIISIDDGEKKKIDYSTSMHHHEEKKEREKTELPDSPEEESGDIKDKNDGKEDHQPPEISYTFSLIDGEISSDPGTGHYHAYEQGIPDDISIYEKDQIHMMEMVKRIWEVQRKKSRGMLNISNIRSLPPDFVLDGHMYGLPASPDTEIIVIGDLHGCYNNLKAVLWQTDFISRVQKNEDIYLVLLGDFFDRGTRTLDGIMPLVFQLVLEYPERVILLRGNHEHFVQNKQGSIESAVRPCETISFWKEHLSNTFFKTYMDFFNTIPLMAFFSNGIIAVHGGIPPLQILTQINVLSDFNNLNGIDTKRLLYSILWTDPGEGDDIPINMKAIFHAPFGKNQFQTFMNKFGIHLMVRGHEAVQNGCEFTYPDSLITIFSAGGIDNPHSFAYNNVIPRFLRITHNHTIEGIKIHWEAFPDVPPVE